MISLTEHSMNGTCRRMSLVPNGGLGSSRMSASTKMRFIMLFTRKRSLEEIEIELTSAQRNCEFSPEEGEEACCAECVKPGAENAIAGAGTM